MGLLLGSLLLLLLLLLELLAHTLLYIAHLPSYLLGGLVHRYDKIKYHFIEQP